MMKYIQSILWVSLLISSGWSAEAKPGGQGKIYADTTNIISKCFKPVSGPVYEVCADYTINWKMWSLMGEPVGDYNLAWQLTQITLMDPKRKIKDIYAPSQIPNELKKGVSAIELYIDGTSYVNGKDIFHHFNTGTAVKAGKGSSINVPESPSWDKLFAYGDECNPFAIGSGTTYADAKLAKNIFVGGVTLSGLSLCSKSGVSELSTLESAIGKLCEKPGADKKYRFCPNQEEKPKKEKNITQPSLSDSILDGRSSNSQSSSFNAFDTLEEQAEHPLIQKKLDQERDNYRYNKALPACKQIMSKIDTCYAQSNCRPKSDEDTQSCYQKTCGNKPNETKCNKYTKHDLSSAPKEREKGVNYIVFSTSSCSEYISNPEFQMWKTCTDNAKQCRVDEVCVNRCNPNHFNTEDECLDKQVRTNGPTYNDAKKLMQKEWNQRAKTGGSLMNSIFD